MWGPEVNADHALVGCPGAWQCWMKVLGRWGVQGVLLGSLVELIVQWEGFSLRRKQRHIWDCFLMACVWSLWLARNGRVFRDKQKRPKDVAVEGMLQGIEWAKANMVGDFCRGGNLLAIENWHQVMG